MIPRAPVLRALVFFVGVFAFASAELPEGFDLEGPLPVDPEVRVGELPNGLRYYVRENGRPENRVSLRLVVHAGSLQEEQNQRGIAHFLEHMAFNGTRHFEEMELVNFLESIGMRFGQHLNASTSFGRTIYQLEVPWDNEEVKRKAMLVLEDWADGITFDPRAINAERGIIMEEWRSGRGAGQRIRDQQYPLIYYNSRYANRLPIGSMPVVQTAPAERFVSFYRDWYRPDLMAVIAVGDFDADEMEAEIKKRFSRLANPEDAPARESYPVPDHEETLFSILSDPELTGTGVTIYLKTDPLPEGNALDYRRMLVERLYFRLLQQRLDEPTLTVDPPYVSASVGRNKLAATKAAYSMSVGLFEGREMEGIQRMVAEVSRAARDGFSQSEFDRERTDMIRMMDRLYQERGNTQSDIFASEYIRAFTSNEPIPGLKLERDMTRAFLNELSLDELNAVGSVFEQEKNRVILYTAPQREGGAALPEEETLLAAIEAGRAMELGAYIDDVFEGPLIAEEPEPGEIVEEIYHEAVDVHEWRLSNGARVVLKSTDFKEQQVVLSGYSEGGTSLVADDEVVPALTATMLVNESGIGEFNTIQLEKRLAGSTARVSLAIGGVSESIGGSTSTADLDDFFRLLYLQIMQPNEENLQVAFESTQKRLEAVLANRDKSPGAVFQDAITETYFGNHARHQPFTVERLEEMDPQLSFEIFEDRFQNAGDFVFVFVGSIQLEDFRPLVERYIGSLPSRGDAPERARWLNDEPARGALSVDLKKGLEEKTSVRVMFTGEAEWSPENRFALMFARSLLTIRMREVLREENGGVYGVSVFGGLSRLPRGEYSTGFGFSCDPANAEELVRLGLREIIELQKRGPRAENIQKVSELLLREHERSLKENGFWLRQLTGLAAEGRPFEEAIRLPQRVANFDPAAAQEAARRYFDLENLLVAYLRPEYVE